MRKIIFKRPPLVRRVLAFALDLLIIDTILFPFESYFKTFIPEAESAEILYEIATTHFTELAIGISFYLILVLTYFSLFEFIVGKTPGKAIFKMKVISMNKERQFSQYLIRNFQVFWLIPFWIVDVLFVFSKKRERLLERVSKTLVIVG